MEKLIDTKKKKISVLSIDGGGIRGIIPAMVLAEFERISGQPISSLFDLIAGTSTGGILALGFTKPDESGNPSFSAKDGINFYEEYGPQIFKESFFRKVKTLGYLNGEKYSGKIIETVLQEVFAEVKLSEALCDLIIPSYDIERRSPYFFKNLKALTTPENDFLMRDVARATSAAPTYFEPSQIKIPLTEDHLSLIDGGVFANNPAMCAYVEAIKMYPSAEEIILVSLGTGQSEERIRFERAKRWGIVGWIQPLVEVIFDGASDAVDYHLNKILNFEETISYYRFQANLQRKHVALDNVGEKNLKLLKNYADKMIQERYGEIEKICKRITGIKN